MKRGSFQSHRSTNTYTFNILSTLMNLGALSTLLNLGTFAHMILSDPTDRYRIVT